MSVTTEWPALPYDEWVETFDTLHMVLQILGKVRVALSPKEPEWAHITLYVSARGLTTGPVPSNVGLFDVEADLLHHHVVIRTADGEVEQVPLRTRPVAEFWSEFTGALAKLGIQVDLPSMPQEVPDPIPFPDDTTHSTYDPEAATRFWRALTVIEPVFASYRADYEGKVSRVQFFWGSADIAVTRFSGEPCTPPTGAGLLDRVAYDYEQMSVGWWPGNASYPRAAFYAYAYPKPDGIADAALDVPGAAWNADLGEFILDHDAVRVSSSPEATLRAFLDAAYDACATRSHWDPRLTGA
jgi:Family of unknown function (DUF5996)